MKEQQLREKLREHLAGREIWFSPRVKWQQCDIWGWADGIWLDDYGIPVFFQLTTASNMSARRKKINHWLSENDFTAPIYLYGYDKKKKEFKIEKLN